MKKKVLNIILNSKKIAVIVFLIYFSLVLFLSLNTFESSTPKVELPHFDKFVHFCFYFGMSFLFFNTLRLSKLKNPKIITTITLLFVIFTGITIELIQPYFNRSADLYDFIANTIGAISGLLFYKFLIKKLNF